MSDGSGDTTTAADPTAPTPEVDQRAEPDDTNTARAKRAEQIRTEMGGAAKVAGLHAHGQKTIRDHIDSFLDPDTFREIGTFSRSMRHDDRASTPGDGKIGGHGLADGRAVAVFGDDVTVTRGSSAIVGGRQEQRLYDRAMAMGTPV
ncbi:MAG: hypothetical protein GY773_13845, partial [Actinomycetia bacterium]|nr:hypothetical protein [Actinomycetes bacterium]